MASDPLGHGADGAGDLRRHQLLVGEAHPQRDEARVAASVPGGGLAVRDAAPHHGNSYYQGHDRANHLWIGIG